MKKKYFCFVLIVLVSLITFVFWVLKKDEVVAFCTPTFEPMYASASDTDAYINGWLSFWGKEDVTEDEINGELKKLDLEFSPEFFGYSLVEHHQVGFVFPSEVEGSEEAFKNLLKNYDLEDALLRYEEGDLIGFIVFPRVLTESERNDVATSMDEIGASLDKQTWVIRSASPYGAVKVPVGKEDDYIEKLQALGLFDCVSRSPHIFVDA